MFRARSVCSLLGVALLFAAACGPSVQTIYEGNVRFEHCYRLDLDLEIVPTHRRHCWEQWLENYRFGQPKDRVDYARRRLRLFANGDFARPTLRLEPSAHPAPGEVYATPEAAPTSVHAPPPPIAAGTAPALPPPNLSATPPAPGAECSDTCQRSRLECRAAKCPESGGTAGESSAVAAGGAGGRSQSDGKPSKPCACDEDYKLCMRRCFE
ncbi:MAG: hypothetical protein M3020_06145 [Myxococcota bacterium]|jgi:hypothetical protein|nr:hypothetical protein [Myxococcota bacterium]